MERNLKMIETLRSSACLCVLICCKLPELKTLDKSQDVGIAVIST